jgi:hypothetical protein
LFRLKIYKEGGIKMIKIAERRYVADDIIAALFLLSKKKFFTIDMRKIQEAVYTLKEKYPDYFEMFGFSKYEIHPFSRELEEALSRLLISRIIRIENTDYKRYMLGKHAKDMESTILEKFLYPAGLSREKLEKMAEFFGQKCGAE